MQSQSISVLYYFENFSANFGEVLAEKFAKLGQKFKFSTTLLPAKRASTLVALSHSLTNCMGSSRLYGGSREFLLIPFGAVVLKNFGEKAESSKFSPFLRQPTIGNRLTGFVETWIKFRDTSRKTGKSGNFGEIFSVIFGAKDHESTFIFRRFRVTWRDFRWLESATIFLFQKSRSKNIVELGLSFWACKCIFTKCLAKKTKTSVSSCEVSSLSSILFFNFCKSEWFSDVKPMENIVFGKQRYFLWKLVKLKARRFYFFARCHLIVGRQIIAMNHLRLQWSSQQVQRSSSMCVLLLGNLTKSFLQLWFVIFFRRFCIPERDS